MRCRTHGGKPEKVRRRDAESELEKVKDQKSKLKWKSK